MVILWSSHVRRTPALGARLYSDQRSKHAQWYSSMLPAMVPIALLGSAVYMVSILASSILPVIQHRPRHSISPKANSHMKSSSIKPTHVSACWKTK
ncbi:hypothetical protein V8B97DRAFT_81942 [Scleroderma yunnanense]